MSASVPSSALVEVVTFPCLDDNYGFLLRDRASGRVATVDTPDAGRIVEELDRRGWTLDLILNTHWHDDHIGGNTALKERYGARIVAPLAEARRIPAIDQPVEEGSVVQLGETAIDVIATPGHTLGHVIYHVPAANIVFVGDTLFAMGCGRLFEGDAAQMWRNMERLAAMPEQTVVFCAHEYTQGNGRFAAVIEPGNEALTRRIAEVADLRARGAATVPTTIAIERATNPFMRAGSVEEFARRRQAKDVFR